MLKDSSKEINAEHWANVIEGYSELMGDAEFQDLQSQITEPTVSRMELFDEDAMVEIFPSTHPIFTFLPK